MSFSIDIQGLDPLLHALAEYRTLFDEEMEQASIDALGFLKSALREYPPERSGQRYVRTFKLQGGWDDAEPHYTSTADGFTATLDNPTSYGPYVQGDPIDTPHQAPTFADYWQTDDAILRDNEAAIRQFYDDATERLVQRLGG